MGFYIGNEPAKVATKVGQGVITSVELGTDSVTTIDILNDAVTPTKIDESSTGYQVGSLGVGTAVSGGDLLKVGGSVSITSSLSVSNTINALDELSVSGDFIAVGGEFSAGVTGTTLALTGALTGTSATFSGNVEIHGSSGTGIKIKSTSATGNKNAIYWQNSSGVEKWRLVNDQSNNLTDDLKLYSNAGGTLAMTVAQSGNTTFSGNVNGSWAGAFSWSSRTASQVGEFQSGTSFTGNVLAIKTDTATSSAFDFLECQAPSSRIPFRVRGDGVTTINTYGVSATGLAVDVALPSSANREIAKFEAGTGRTISVGWIDSGSKMSLYTSGNHSLVFGTGALGTNDLEIDASGNTTFSGKVEVGTFSNSTTNTGEAWIGRASDRADGTLTVQLGGDNATGTKFEIVDRAWTKVISSISGEAPSSSFSINSSGNATFGKHITAEGGIEQNSYSTTGGSRGISGNCDGFAGSVFVVGAKSGLYTTCTVEIQFPGAGGWQYEVMASGTGCTRFQTGGGYTNGTSNFSHTSTSGANWTVTSPSSNKVRLVSTGTIGYHPICSVKAYSGLSSGLTAEDISITWS